MRRRSARRPAAPARRQILEQHAGDLGGAAPLGIARDLEHPHAAVERDGDDIAGTHRPAGGLDARAVDADMTCAHQRGSGAARAHHARVPQPFVDALTVQFLRAERPTVLDLLAAMPFLVGLELLLERQQLGERRIRIGLLAARLLARAPGRDGRLSSRRSRSRSRSRRGGRPERSGRSGRSPRSGRSRRWSGLPVRTLGALLGALALLAALAPAMTRAAAPLRFA